MARILCAGGQAGFINEPFNLAVSPGSIRVPVDHWYTYVARHNEQQVMQFLGPTLEFEYPLARELRRCRNRIDLHHTLKTWREYRRSRGRRPLVKDPHAVFSAPWFAERLHSQIVVVIREPLAVVSSWKRLGWIFDFGDLLAQPALMSDWLSPFEPEIRAAVSEPASLVDAAALFWHVVYSVIADSRYPRVHLVRHEDLSTDPVGQYAKLYDALGLRFTDEVARAVAASSSSSNPAETTVERPHVTELDSRANLDNWRHRLTDEEVSRIRHLTAATAARYYPERIWT
jgi:hypothetical protein